jgi:hypothetical protein
MSSVSLIYGQYGHLAAYDPKTNMITLLEGHFPEDEEGPETSEGESFPWKSSGTPTIGSYWRSFLEFSFMMNWK